MWSAAICSSPRCGFPTKRIVLTLDQLKLCLDPKQGLTKYGKEMPDWFKISLLSEDKSINHADTPVQAVMPASHPAR